MADPNKIAQWKDLLGRLTILLVGICVMVIAVSGVSLYLIDSPMDLEIRGRWYLLTNHTDHAITTYIRLTQIDPDNQRAFRLVGDLYSAKGSYVSAFPFYSKAAELEPSVSNLVHAGIAAQRSGLKDEAAKYYRRVLQTDPENVTAADYLVSDRSSRDTSAPAVAPLDADNRAATEKGSQHDGPAKAQEETEPDRSRVGTLPAQQERSVLSALRALVRCNVLLRETKLVVSGGQPEWLASLTLRVGPPHRTCVAGSEATYCFRCLLRGGLTESMEIVEKDGRASGYSFGSCACREKRPTRGTEEEH